MSVVCYSLPLLRCHSDHLVNTSYGLPPGPLDFNQDGVVEDYEELAHDYERMSNNRRFNYRDASGLACARGWFYS